MYPLKFEPIFQQRIWGGRRLKDVLAKHDPHAQGQDCVGEAWELADLPPGTVKKDSAGGAADGSFSNRVTNGPWKGQTLHQILTRYNQPAADGRRPLTGNAPLTHGHFPLLIKFLDAQTDLSVQVHPDDKYCAANPQAHLKSEAWYIMHADPGAKIYKGVKPGVTKEAFRAALQTGDVEPLLKAIPVRTGDCHYLKSGTVHALGAGILAAEVQTPSDTTFRVFDWNRLGADGKPRALHIDEAMAVIDFSPVTTDPAGIRSHVAGMFTAVSRLVNCEYFTLERVRMSESVEQEIPYAEPVVWIVLDGQGVITCDGAGPTAFTKGDTLLLPANIANAKVKTITDTLWLEAKLPGGAVEIN
jgi:mannose-6-phosphate isomerase